MKALMCIVQVRWVKILLFGVNFAICLKWGINGEKPNEINANLMGLFWTAATYIENW